MPTTSRVFIKASIIHLCLGALLGAMMFINRWLAIDARLWALRDSHVSLLIVGWLTQLIVGVAWWLFPPRKIGLVSGGRRPLRRGQAQRGSETLFWATFAFLNAGVLLASTGEPLAVWTGAQVFRSVADASDPLFMVAAATFVWNMWQRVRAVGG